MVKYKNFTWIGVSGNIYYGIKKRLLWFFWVKMHLQFTRENEANAAIKALNGGFSPRGGFGIQADPNKPPKPPISFKW